MSLIRCPDRSRVEQVFSMVVTTPFICGCQASLMNAILNVIKPLDGICLYFIVDNSGICDPVLIVNCADSLNRNYGFSGQRDELPNTHAKDSISMPKGHGIALTP